ncbi:hypothetical protein CGCS363_v000989 [Colletotrichum siamense]|uniref:uncharacterized protein n=1 Tax=Colletotrichum siamense TaxID=690259 RepID=UPI001872E807|nr:uncharacterized protein CGCS363_v000989 [Colletotrichum siamense]KAF5516085.1 hypothetical protein CGCS363_v000989 [Colletotrichum siamense]
MLRDAWKNLLNTGSEDRGTAKIPKQISDSLLSSELDETLGTAKKSKKELGRLLRSQQNSIPEPPDRKKQFETSQQPDYWFRRKALRKYMEVFALAVVGNLFLIGPMILMVLKPGLITSLVTTTICVTSFAAVAPMFLDKIGEVVSATAAYAAVLHFVKNSFVNFYITIGNIRTLFSSTLT